MILKWGKDKKNEVDYLFNNTKELFDKLILDFENSEN